MAPALILNDNARGQLRPCLLGVQAFTPTPHELIVVDPGSVDGSVEHLREADIASMTFEADPGYVPAPARAEMVALVTRRT
jgi:hypothetical protein